MTAGAINDPDLVQAIDELQYVVMRMESLHQQIVDLDETEGYGRIVKLRAEAGELRDRVRVRADKLKISPRALALVVGTANRLRTDRKRKLPTLAAVLNHIEIARSAAERDHLEAEAEARMARAMARGAGLRAQAGADAMAYLEASRS